MRVAIQIACLLFTTGCLPVEAGSGHRIAEPRTLAAFERLKNRSSIDVRLNGEGVTEAVLTCDDNLLDRIETTVSGDTLVVDTRDGVSFSTAQPCVLDVLATRLVEVVASGSGDIVGVGPFDDVQQVTNSGSGDLALDGVRSEDLSTVASGSGELRLTNVMVASLAASGSGSGDTVIAGSATAASLVASGSGDVDLRDLPVTNASASLSGSGDGRVQASGTVTGSISGSGDLHVSGGAEVSVAHSGSGEVIED
jgi:hypothetical protein